MIADGLSGIFNPGVRGLVQRVCTQALTFMRTHMESCHMIVVCQGCKPSRMKSRDAGLD